MGVYEREPGVWRIVVHARGKQHERIVRGPRELALQAEEQLRVQRGARSKKGEPLALELGESGNPSTIYVGGHKYSYVYFIQQGDDGPIKIGFSSKTLIRLSQMQSGNPAPLRLLALIPGGVEMERTIHSAFSAHRLSGEWFSPTKALLKLISEARSESGRPPEEVALSRSTKGRQWRRRTKKRLQ